MAGTVLIAPGGKHLILRKEDNHYVAALNNNPPVKSCRPSVDVLFRSVAGIFKTPVLSVVLTGMGDDGADGVQTLSRYGSYNLTQEKNSCVVYGMPKAVVDRDLADEELPLKDIASKINELTVSGGGCLI